MEGGGGDCLVGASMRHSELHIIILLKCLPPWPPSFPACPYQTAGKHIFIWYSLNINLRMCASALKGYTEIRSLN